MSEIKTAEMKVKHNKPKCPQCDRYGKVFKTAFSEQSFACRRCDIWFVLPLKNSEYQSPGNT